jgi:hypothetical protein
MNERIRELVKQAGIELPDDTVYNGHIYKNSIERLVNLLEQEFFSAGYQAGKSDGIQETVRDCADFLMDTLDDHFAAEQLQEHFGVE